MVVVVLVTSGELVVVLPLVELGVMVVLVIAVAATARVSSTASWAPHSEQKWSVPLFSVPQNGQVIVELLSLSQAGSFFYFYHSIEKPYVVNSGPLFTIRFIETEVLWAGQSAKCWGSWEDDHSNVFSLLTGCCIDRYNQSRRKKRLHSPTGPCGMDEIKCSVRNYVTHN
jgi:hypothetical protein